MKKNLLTKMLLLATGLLAGASAWAYDVPEGYEVKNVFLGTANSDGTVTVENFEAMTSLSSSWGAGTMYTNSGSTHSLQTITEVAKPEVGQVVNSTTVDDVTTFDKPTYVGGKAVMFRNRTNRAQTPYGTYSFDAVSTGKFVFSADLYTITSALPMELTFVDSEGNTVIKFHWNNGSGTRPFNYEYTDAEGNATTGGDTYGYCDYRTYHGYGIKDFVLDFATGGFEFTIDFINTRDANAPTRNQVKFTGTTKTGLNIAQLRLGTPSQAGNTANYDTYIDNVALYTVGVEAGNYTYTINAVSNGTTIKENIATGDCKGGMTYSASVPYIIKDDNGVFYVLDDAKVKNYQATFTMGSENEVREINYSKDESGIVYYIEGENLGGSSESQSVSNGGYGHVNSGNGSSNHGKSIGNFPIGKYVVSAYFVEKDISRNRGLFVRNYNAGNDVNEITNVKSTTVGLYSTVEFTLYAETTLALSGSTTSDGKDKVNQSADLDYVIVRRTGDVFETLSLADDKEFATFNSDYALNFAGITDVLAYTAKVSTDGKSVTLAKVEGAVPANTGLLIRKGDKASADVPVVATAAEVENEFIAVTADNCDEGQDYLTVKDGYILATVDGVQGFYKANSSNGTKVGKGKAYLPATGANGARLTLNFGDETTAIETVMVVENSSDAIYNLNGQRVAAPQKGLYIVNGKKTIMK